MYLCPFLCQNIQLYWIYSKHIHSRINKKRLRIEKQKHNQDMY